MVRWLAGGPSSAALQRAFAILGSRSTRPATALLERFYHLLRTGGPLGSLRLDRQRFDKAVASRLPEIGRNPSDAQMDALFARALGEIVGEWSIEDLKRQLTDAAWANRLSGEDLDAAALAFVMLSATPTDEPGSRLARDVPPLRAIFGAQLEERIGELQRVDDVIERAAADITSERDVQAILAEATSAGLPDDVLSTLSTLLSASNDADLDRIERRSLKALRRKEPPALFTLDEYLWLSCCTQRALADDVPSMESALVEAVIAALDADLVSGVTQRLLGWAADPDLTRRDRVILGELALAFCARPGVLALEALDSGAVLAYRDPEEVLMASALLSEKHVALEDVHHYERWLADRGETTAAARVRRAADLQSSSKPVQAAAAPHRRARTQ